MRSLRITPFLCAMFFIFLPTGLSAQLSNCPPPTNSGDSGERLKYKHCVVLEEQGKMIDKLENRFGQVIPAGDIARMKKAHGRAAKAKERMTSKHFKSLVKKNPEICDLAVFPGTDLNGNGICDYPGEKCLGKDGGICKIKGKNREGCVEVCGGDEETMQDDVDPLVQADVEESYDDLTKSLEEANSTLEENGPLMASMAQRSLLAASEPAESCKASVDGLAIAEALATTVTKLAATTTRGIVDIADKWCNQDAGGFNCASCCAAMEALHLVNQLLADGTEAGFRVAKAFAGDSTMACMSSLSADLQETKTTLGTLESTTSGNSGQLAGVVSDVESIKTTVNNLTTKVNALNATVNAVQQRTTELFETMNNRFNNVETILNTPQGRRDSFPSRK